MIQKLCEIKRGIVLFPVKRATLPAGFTLGGSLLNHGPTWNNSNEIGREAPVGLLEK